MDYISKQKSFLAGHRNGCWAARLADENARSWKFKKIAIREIEGNLGQGEE